MNWVKGVCMLIDPFQASGDVAGFIPRHGRAAIRSRDAANRNEGQQNGSNRYEGGWGTVAVLAKVGTHGACAGIFNFYLAPTRLNRTR